MEDLIRITDWEQLELCESETHVINLNHHSGSGWIQPKIEDPEKNYLDQSYYLSTHTFYNEGTCKEATEALQRFGFSVVLIPYKEFLQIITGRNKN